MASLSSQDIRDSVAASYGRRVREILHHDELLPLAESASCCGPATGTDSCCDTETSSASSCCGVNDDSQIERVAALYAGSGIDDLPATVTDVAFGCGNPTAIAALRPGETVLDLGSGGGIDCFLAAKMVGPGGRVYGVDMTPEMVELAEANRAKVGATNVEFRRGEIEALPFDAATIDVVISNCVINLSPDKDAVFREAFRVLRPGGRLQVSDMVWTGDAADVDRSDMEAWAGCVAGALTEDSYLAKIRAAGFVDVVSETAASADGRGLASANVVARRPA